MAEVTDSSTTTPGADDVAAPAATEGAAGAGTGRLRALKLPALKLPMLKLPALKLPAVKRPAVKLPAVKLPARPVLRRPVLRRPAFRVPRPGRPALADLVFSLGAATLVVTVVFVASEPARARLQARTDETVITANAATLQLAAETYAACNGGSYPRSARELLPFLPRGLAPRNPYTGEPTLFRGIAGDLTYRPAAGGGYVIEAWGRGAARPRLLATLHGAPPASGH